MNKSLVLLAAPIAALWLSAAAYAAPPSAEQKDDFYKVCYGISENAKLCGCKADAAIKLIDSEFMAVVIASMRGKDVPADLYAAYNEYIGRSNQICKPEY